VSRAMRAQVAALRGNLRAARRDGQRQQQAAQAAERKVVELEEAREAAEKVHKAELEAAAFQRMASLRKVREHVKAARERERAADERVASLCNKVRPARWFAVACIRTSCWSSVVARLLGRLMALAPSKHLGVVMSAPALAKSDSLTTCRDWHETVCHMPR
jgi:hypothetical protein